MSAGDQVSGIAFLGGEAAPNLGDEEGNVVIDSDARADVSGGSGESGQSGQDVGDEGVVQIGDGAEGVEGGFGQGAFAAGAGGGGAFAGEGADEIHEEFGEFLVMNGIVNGESANSGGFFFGVVAPADQDGVHGGEHGMIGGGSTGETHGLLCQVDGEGVH